MHDNPMTNRFRLLLLLPFVLAAGTVAASCKDDDCSKLENIKWTCASRYCQAGGAGSALCFCWQHDMALGSWTAGSCTDFKDNDEDGFTDCDDVDCRRSEACNCDNGEDDDGNGAVDCDDIQCANSPYCCSLAERAPMCCHDGIDNDGDGLTDCESDPDCALACCNDGTDNDGDGLTDCDDPDCSGSPDCCGQNAEACACNDNQDNDEDGLVDCQDPDCLNADNCQNPAQSRFSERIGYCVDQLDVLSQGCDEQQAKDQLVDFDCVDFHDRAQTGLLGKMVVDGSLRRTYDPVTGEVVSEQSLDPAFIHGLDSSGQDKNLSRITFYDNGWFDSNISRGVWFLRRSSGLVTGAISIRFLSDACLEAPDFCDPNTVTSWRKTQEGAPMAYEVTQVGEGSKLLLVQWTSDQAPTFDAVVLKHQTR